MEGEPKFEGTERGKFHVFYFDPKNPDAEAFCDYRVDREEDADDRFERENGYKFSDRGIKRSVVNN